MPFPIVYGVPANTPVELLKQLRRDIVSTLVSKGIKQDWIHPFFPMDFLDTPTEPEEGCSTIFVSLETAMLEGRASADQIAEDITTSLAKTVWEAFRGELEVEVFIGRRNPIWKCLLPAKPDFVCCPSCEQLIPSTD